MDLEKYRALFVEESRDHLAEMGRALGELEKTDDRSHDADGVECLFRMAHSIKGMAASLDFAETERLAHRLESWMEPLRSQEAFAPALLAPVWDAVAALESMVASVAAGGEPGAADPDLMRRLSGPPREGPGGTLPGRAAGRAPAAPPGGTSPPATPVAALPPTVRVSAAALDRFLAAAGDVLQHQSRVEALVQSTPWFEGRGELIEELERTQRATADLRRRALAVRTTGIRRLFDRVPRVVSELARRLGKRVEVELIGDEVEADRAVLDHLDEPLLHLVRNALDHGVETPSERTAGGKPEAGRLCLEARRRGARLVVRVSDDGRGICVERVRRKAVERGLLPEAVAEDLPDSRLIELIFEPALSTRDEVTSVSGRGVGLDSVRRSVEAIGGAVHVESHAGRGTLFELDLPSTIAVQRLLILRLHDDRVTLPAARVERVVALDEGVVEGAGGDAFFVWNDEPLPLLPLAAHLRLGSSAGPKAGPGPGGVAVVIEIKGFRLAIGTDQVVGEREVSVRAVPKLLAGQPLLGGVAVMPDGVPVFVLEPAALLEDVA
ncbi:MAG: chemotaxis protein CheA [Myxococcota bacterium]